MSFGYTEPKVADPIYSTVQHAEWRRIVLERAGLRCQFVEHGRRCQKAAPFYRMFADHIVELKDGGAPFDPANGQCLCGRHHTKKTNVERTKRLAPSDV